MYRDKKTGAPYIVPLFTQPGQSQSANRPIIVLANNSSGATSARLREEALGLLRRFLDAAPGAGHEARGGAGAYPVPGGGQGAGGMEEVPLPPPPPPFGEEGGPAAAEAAPELSPGGFAPAAAGPGSFL